MNKNKPDNYAIISSGVNKELGGNAPSIYRDKMFQDKIDQILESALCPDNLFDNDYATFIEEHAEMLASESGRLMGV